MHIELIKENPDGSADYAFDVSEEEKAHLVPAGVQLLILLGITGLTFDEVCAIVFKHKEDSNESNP